MAGFKTIIAHFKDGEETFEKSFIKTMRKGEKMIKCSSCKREVTSDYIKFKCPKCGKSTITRCAKCRETVTGYVCEECGFSGP